MRSGFFNSVNGDRKYNASSFAEYFSSFIANGVFPNPSNSLQVMSNNDMSITVKAGKAWIDGYILINDSDYNIDIDVADGLLNRIDRVVARLDTTDREIRVEVKEGGPASIPLAPVLQRDADAYELAIADIYIAKGAVSITQANITDTRLNNSVCGIVKGILDEIDTTTIFNQYQSWLIDKNAELNTWFDTTTVTFENDFNSWFLSIQDILDTNIAADLLNQIDTINDNLLLKLGKTEKAADSDKLNGQLASYYTDIVARLGYTPLNSTATAVDSAKLGGALPSTFAKTNVATNLFLNSTVNNYKILSKGNYGIPQATSISTTINRDEYADKVTICSNASAIIKTIPSNEFVAGDIANFIKINNSVTFTTGAGMTLYSAPDNTKRSIKDKYSMVSLYFFTPTICYLIGSIE